mmetsp:Transcript_15098/g.30446  ORF Transcript_15098/g.30446 Transcript_15098/m.30446 type:complete len:257 (+) Transcript_15098:1427-2197(+)
MSTPPNTASADVLVKAFLDLVQREPLTDEEKEVVKEIMRGASKDAVVSTFNCDPITLKSIRKLRPSNKLNDEVVNIFMAVMRYHDSVLCDEDPSRSPSHCFNTHFIDKLVKDGHDGVKRWSKKVPGKNIFALDKVFVPINVDDWHWRLAVISMKEKTIQCIDSMGLPGTSHLEALKGYFEAEHEAKKGAPLPDADDWELIEGTSETPQQENGFDCGVFMLMACILLAVGEPLDFSQEDIALFRERITVLICKANDV